jgi:predicted ATPase/DNA-binding CsgD family transcriptional regulator
VTTQPVSPVSQREEEVLAAVGEHLSNAQIASRLHLSVRTVETHVSSLLRKLGAADRRALAAMAPALVGSVDAPVHTAGAVRGLPAAWTPFVGRERERSEILAALTESRLVTILGPGGAGKTRIAAVVAQEFAAGLPLGAVFVELVSARGGFLVQAVASVLGVTEQPGASLQDGIADRLRRGPALLVLDNCEHLLGDVAEFLTGLLAQAGDLVVLTTSRERIGVPGERVVPLAGLSVTAARTGGAAESDAVRLFLDRARAVDGAFDADPGAVGDVCAQLDGMPLAIELAAARAATLGIGGLRAGLTDRLRLLSGGRSADERHRSLRAMLDWSHELLDEDERTALRRLARFAGDFDLDSAAAVTGRPVGTVADLVGRLADKSLVVHRRADLDGRWALLDTVRAYASEKLAAAGELDATRERYTQWALATAAELEQRLAGNAPWRDALDLVLDDLRAALRGTRDPENARALARLLGHLTYARRFLAEAREHYLTAAEVAGTAAHAAEDLWLAAKVAHCEQRGDVVFDLHLAAAERAAAAGDARRQATVLAEAISIGSRFPAIFPTDVPLERLQQLLATAERVAPPGDELVRAQVAAARAWTHTRLVEVPDPAPFEAALRAARAVDDPATISAMLDAVSSADVMAGRLRRAYESSVERLDLLARLPGHDPPAGAELHDILHMATENAITAGELPAALAAARLFADESTVPVTAHMKASKPIVALVLSGAFDAAIRRGRFTREVWEHAGAPPARWLGPQMYAVSLALALRGFGDEGREWAAFTLERIAGLQTRNVHFQVGGMVTFADARLAVHEGRLADALTAVAAIPAEKDAWSTVRHWYFDAYPWAMAAEAAVLADAPDADARLAAAEPVTTENRWAAACLARARGRRFGDEALLRESVAAWERIGARYERACTLLLLPDRADEGLAELAALGVAPPAV